MYAPVADYLAALRSRLGRDASVPWYDTAWSFRDLALLGGVWWFLSVYYVATPYKIETSVPIIPFCFRFQRLGFLVEYLGLSPRLSFAVILESQWLRSSGCPCPAWYWVRAMVSQASLVIPQLAESVCDCHFEAG